MKSVFALFFLLFCINALNAQKQYLTIKDSDVEAIKIVNRSKSLIRNASSIEILYKITSYFPESKPTVLNGIAKQQGIKYFIESGDKNFYCDGTSLVVWNRTQNSAQINDLSEKSGILTPNGLLKSYDEKKYIFALGEKSVINKKTLQQIVLKPADKRSEYTKIELLINTKSGFPDEIKMFLKDGTKNYLKINSVKLNQK
jgi:outer membrane lipoprotein-sorting protein